MRPAAPSYVGTEFGACPPGHRFRMYFDVWSDRWGTQTISIKKGKPHFSDNKGPAMTRVVPVGPFSDLADALAERQGSIAPTPESDTALQVTAWCTAPLATGLGMEHPIENGFAFLDPYGLPYLPGSSIKGVLRRAAEELALFEPDASHGWSILAIWWLLGFDATSGFFSGQGTPRDGEDPVVAEERKRWRDAYLEQGARDHEALIEAFIDLALQKESERSAARQDPERFLARLQDDTSLRSSIHLRGSLDFWDAYPKLPGTRSRSLHLDIMTPHFGHYSQGKGTEPPGDWGDPVPIQYLTLPQATELRFVVTLDPVGSLPEALLVKGEDERPRWKQLVDAALTHAFEWIGFGAKTSQGYGLMTRSKGEAETGPAVPHPLHEKVQDFDFRKAGPEGAKKLLEQIERVKDEDALKDLTLSIAQKIPDNGLGRIAWRAFPKLERIKG